MQILDRSVILVEASGAEAACNDRSLRSEVVDGPEVDEADARWTKALDGILGHPPPNVAPIVENHVVHAVSAHAALGHQFVDGASEQHKDAAGDEMRNPA